MKQMVVGLFTVSALTVATSFAAPALGSEACPGLVARHEPLIVPAALGSEDVRITFVGHATFLIESPGGIRIATDYNDYVRPQVTPDVATMNRAHATHHSYAPDPSIRHVLRGWDAPGKAARHDLQV